MAKVEWLKADDVKRQVRRLLTIVDRKSLDINRIHCFRSQGSKARAYARIWGLPSIWQKVLSAKPQYILEVLAENYDKLSEKRKIEVLIHELTHIPENFSGALIPHIRHGKRNFHKKVDMIIREVFQKKFL